MGLVGMAARTAVVAGTATAVSGRVARRQEARYEQKADAQAYQQQQAQPPPQQYAPPPPQAPAATGAADTADLPAQLQQLADMRQQGILSEEEFQSAKAKLLGQ